jgi:hypothetical protein
MEVIDAQSLDGKVLAIVLSHYFSNGRITLLIPARAGEKAIAADVRFCERCNDAECAVDDSSSFAPAVSSTDWLPAREPRARAACTRLAGSPTPQSGPWRRAALTAPRLGPSPRLPRKASATARV